MAEETNATVASAETNAIPKVGENGKSNVSTSPPVTSAQGEYT